MRYMSGLVADATMIQVARAYVLERRIDEQRRSSGVVGIQERHQDIFAVTVYTIVS
jgi:hypothetical protein